MPYPRSRLDRLDDLLEASPAETMTLSQLDGFLTALALAPEPVPVSEWISRVWVDDAAATPLLEAGGPQVAAILEAVQEQYDAVVHSLNGEPDQHDCLFEQDDDGAVLWDGWIEGFMEAVVLRPDAWEALAGAEGDAEAEAADAVNLLLALSELARGEGEIPEDEARQMTEEAEDLIPELVQALNQRRLDLIPRPAPRKIDQIGRNDPCPCGSGKKYKKCCGAAA